MYHFIINPNARSGLGLLVWQKLELILQDKNIPYHTHFTEHPRHASSYARALTINLAKNNEHLTLVAIGGDGTVNEVLDGMTNFEHVTFGYIPVGSGNDFARSLSIPKKGEDALELILQKPHIASMDIGSLSFENHTRRFAVSAGLGFDAAVCEEANNSKLKPFLNKLRLGKLTYVGIALKLILLSRLEQITLTLDDQKPIVFQKGLFAVVMNHRYEGGGFKFCPNARYNDGELDVMVIAGLPKLKILTLLPTALKGAHTRFHGVYSYRCKKAVIETEHAFSTHMDGEVLSRQTRIEARCCEEKLRIIVPKFIK